jgi:CRISPR-associated protein Cmr2
MNPDEVWADKIAQMFHDPFVKAFCQGDTARAVARDLAEAAVGVDEVTPLLWDAFAQDKVAALLSVRLLGEDLVLPYKPVLRYHGAALAAEIEAGILPARLQPDHAAAGADRPVLGTSRHVNVRLWEAGREHVTVTHPLSAAPLVSPAPRNVEDLVAWLRPAYERLDAYRAMLPARGWERYRQAWYAMWRRLPEDLALGEGPAPGGLFWPLQPADTRTPDHSIWDHLRVASSLAFIPATKAADERVRGDNPGKRPWLVSLWVGPASDYVGQARTGRDLWTGSMLLSELAWALVEPIVEALGADAILYPDLRANPRADLWIEGHVGPEALGVAPGRSYASLIPNRVVALVPEGDLDHLVNDALNSARTRWNRMADAARANIEGKIGADAWTAIFDRQVKRGPNLRWSAARWTWDGIPPGNWTPTDVHLDPAIPFQRDAPRMPEPLRDLEAKRRARYEGWLPDHVFDHYQSARMTQLVTWPSYLLSQRGFDYPLAHNQLLALDRARARLGWTPGEGEPGEKCTLCGARQALSNATSGAVGEQRRAARLLWKTLGDEGDGSERLCGVCAVRRFLSDTDDPINRQWKGDAERRGRGGRRAAPFPSTGLIAAQAWLITVAGRYDTNEPGYRAAVGAVAQAFRATELAETQFPDALTRTRRLAPASGGDLERFLRIDIQHLDPEAWAEISRSGERGTVRADAARGMERACRGLRALPDIGAPKTRIAVIMLDGDRMGRLLLGEATAVKARWRDVLHPDAVKTLRSGEQRWKMYWRTTMEQARLMGPSTHAFVTRVLREFSNRVVPWVAEREFGGRLIYAGGDDALILCPAAEALGLVSRLYELFTAPWVIDTAPRATNWPDLEPLDDDLYGLPGARRRFEVVGRERTDDLDDTGPYDIRDRRAGRVIPMMGENQSFSAGIAFGHYKTSLRVLRLEAARGQAEAKAAGGARAGLAWSTRSGVKLRCVAPLAPDRPGGVRDLQELEQRFAEGRLPGRLPYKLRASLPAAVAVLGSALAPDRRERLIKALVHEALDGKDDENDRATRVWIAALEGSRDAPEASLHGLLIARALGGADGDGENDGAGEGET